MVWFRGGVQRRVTAGAEGPARAQDRGRLIVVQLRVAQGGILINAGCSVLAQRLNLGRAAAAVLLVSYDTLALLGLGKKMRKPHKGITIIQKR